MYVHIDLACVSSEALSRGPGHELLCSCQKLTASICIIIGTLHYYNQGSGLREIEQLYRANGALQTAFNERSNKPRPCAVLTDKLTSKCMIKKKNVY